MHNRQRDFLLLVILAAASMTSALGQGVAPAVGPENSSTQSTASIPDFSGTWSNQSLNALELPLFGSRPGEEQVARADRTASRSGRWPPIGRRLYQSDLAALGGGSREEVGRDFVGRQGLSDPAQPVLARGMPFVSVNRGMKIIQQPENITILYPFDHQFRQVRMNQPHPA
jgi:hypothetical protein